MDKVIHPSTLFSDDLPPVIATSPMTSPRGSLLPGDEKHLAQVHSGLPLQQPQVPHPTQAFTSMSSLDLQHFQQLPLFYPQPMLPVSFPTYTGHNQFTPVPQVNTAKTQVDNIRGSIPPTNPATAFTDDIDNRGRRILPPRSARPKNPGRDDVDERIACAIEEAENEQLSRKAALPTRLDATNESTTSITTMQPCYEPGITTSSGIYSPHIHMAASDSQNQFAPVLHPTNTGTPMRGTLVDVSTQQAPLHSLHSFQQTGTRLPVPEPRRTVSTAKRKRGDDSTDDIDDELTYGATVNTPKRLRIGGSQMVPTTSAFTNPHGLVYSQPQPVYNGAFEMDSADDDPNNYSQQVASSMVSLSQQPANVHMVESAELVNSDEIGAPRPPVEAWTENDDAKLRQLVAKYGSVKDIDWYDIAIQMGKSRIECQKRWTTHLQPSINNNHFTPEEDDRIKQHYAATTAINVSKKLRNMKGGTRSIRKWTPEEDEKLRQLVAKHGKDFKEIAKHIPGRGQEDCRSRWMRHLDPTLNKSPFTPQEDKRILELHALLANRWTAIAKKLGSHRVGVDVQRRCSVLKRNGAKIPPPNPKDLEDAELMEDLAHVTRGPARNSRSSKPQNDDVEIIIINDIAERNGSVGVEQHRTHQPASAASFPNLQQ